MSRFDESDPLWNYDPLGPFTREEWQSAFDRANRPAQEIFDELVEDGIIDRSGNVLVRMPTFGPVDEDERAETAGGDPAGLGVGDASVIIDENDPKYAYDPQGPFTREEWQSIVQRANRPAQEKFDDLVANGIIDRNFNVLVRMPTFGPDDEVDQADQ